MRLEVGYLPLLTVPRTGLPFALVTEAVTAIGKFVYGRMTAEATRDTGVLRAIIAVIIAIGTCVQVGIAAAGHGVAGPHATALI